MYVLAGSFSEPRFSFASGVGLSTDKHRTAGPPVPPRKDNGGYLLSRNPVQTGNVGLGNEKMQGLRERKEQVQQYTKLCVFRGKLAGLCSGRETPSGTKRRAQSGEIMLIVCTGAGERHPK